MNIRLSRNIQRDTDALHQMGKHYLRRVRLGIHGCAIHGVAARRISAIGPVHDAIGKIEFQVDRLRQVVEPDFDVAAVGRGLAFWNFDIRAENAAEPRVIRPLLRPVNLLRL